MLKCGKPYKEGDSIDKITSDKWTKIQTNAKEWKGLDKFGDVWDTTTWEDGQQGRFMHNNCYITLCSSVKLDQAVIRDANKAKEKLVAPVQQPPSSSDSFTASPPQKRTRLSTGVIHLKDQCVWCMKKKDQKHPNRSNKLVRIEKTSRWKEFKRHVPFLEDVEMRRRITCLIDSTTDPFAADILYHASCWTKYVLNTANAGLDTDLHDVNLDDGRKLFFRHVDDVIFKKREIRALQ